MLIISGSKRVNAAHLKLYYFKNIFLNLGISIYMCVSFLSKADRPQDPENEVNNFLIDFL